MNSFKFGSHELDKALKVFAWSFASAVVALALALVDLVEFPVNYAFIVPIINTLLYALKEYIADNR